MVTVKDIFSYFEKIVPTSMKLGNDNPGFLLGDGNNTVNKVLVALDITDEVVDEAVNFGADLIVSHHPLFFSIESASTETLIGRKIVKLLNNKISAICLHTNLDSVDGGVNDALMNILGATIDGILDPYGKHPDGTPYGIGRFGRVEKKELSDFLKLCKTALNCNGLRYVDSGRPVHKIAVCGGSGGSMLSEVAALGCDTYVTSDIKHNGFIDAKELRINLIDAGHFSTENVVVPVLRDMIKNAFPDIEVILSEKHCQPEQYYI